MNRLNQIKKTMQSLVDLTCVIKHGDYLILPNAHVRDGHVEFNVVLDYEEAGHFILDGQTADYLEWNPSVFFSISEEDVAELTQAVKQWLNEEIDSEAI